MAINHCGKQPSSKEQMSSLLGREVQPGRGSPAKLLAQLPLVLRKGPPLPPHSLIHPFIHLLIHSFTHSLIHSQILQCPLHGGHTTHC